MNPSYSVCITHYNNKPTLKQSLESILAQIDSSYEIVVVDNESNDGSKEILGEYSRLGRLKLVSAHCSRGRGRQIAFENSSGAYVVSNMDFDDVFKPRLPELLSKYQVRCKGELLWVRSTDNTGFWEGENFMIAPRELLSRLGGWRDLQFGEDWELARRAAHAGSYRWTNFQLLERTNAHPERKTSIGRIRFRYERYRDLLRCGRSVFKKGQHISLTQRLPLVLAKISLPFYDYYGNEGDHAFEPYLTSCFIDFGEKPMQD